MNAMKEQFLNGEIILIDKPLGWTSFQVVNKIRWLIRSTYGIKKIKVGHAGTLDPLASGLLILCTGKMTKSIEQFMGQEKEYTGTFTLGATTPSYDLETEIDHTFPTDHITEELLQTTLDQFVGTIDQYPPVFSALKKDGKRLYEFAREGVEVEIPTRKVNIRSFELTQKAIPKVDFKVICSKGTYIRSLANDYGKALNSGAHLSALRRTRIGKFNIEQAVSIEDFEKQIKK
ncbi:tRNA pseudouridine(55) synthase TruB [Flavobacteriaceae bacterium]|jgi:tRNA pseudouridine55 synthase|nr:tRNA pseudouridine(55) synthase TruB [Flavobacteriaceae bacterium]MDB4066892.1 tRNA pseudouridine(55) synthase TruB [Flavobacteriaceae bacterium]MDB4152354.1 tRNA pseudouridine(55) synthase TruB [Flavobacteriaceae bacterium]|tara:strand:- start:3718 stop:4413 length:696 start_codon:yes stop_codon:yes gene_type:complete